MLRWALIAAFGGVLVYLFSDRSIARRFRGMGEGEARRILGIGPDADADAVKAAHRALIKAAHPDSGGDVADAARINQARDVLLKTRE